MTRMMDMTLMIRRLQDTGQSVEAANRIYGAYATLAIPVFSLLPSLIAPISMALIPQLNVAIGRASQAGQRAAIETALRLTVLISMPASMGILLFARPILNLLFVGEYEAIAICAPLLASLGMSVLFSCLITTTNAILQSYRKVSLPILSMGIGVLVKAASEYVLMGLPGVGAMGAPISTFFCNVAVTVINLYFVLKDTKDIRIGLHGILLKPILPSLAAVLGAFAAYLPLESRVGNGIALLVGILLALCLYLIFSFLFGALRREDLELLPLGTLMVKRMGRNKKMKE